MKSEEAWQLVNDFVSFIESGRPIMGYNNELPHEKDQIISAFLKIFEETDFGVLAKEKKMSEYKIRTSLTVLLGTLVRDYIPDEEEYKKLKESLELIRVTSKFI